MDAHPAPRALSRGGDALRRTSPRDTAAPRRQNFVFPWVVDTASALGAGQGMCSGNRWGSDPVHTRPLFDYILQYWSLFGIRNY